MSKPCKIALISPAHPLRGGIAALSERLALELQHHGYEVTIVSFSLQYPPFLFPGKTQYSSDPAPEGLRIEPWINSINPINWVRTGLRLRRLNPDLIVVRYWLPFMAPSLGSILRIGRPKGTPVVAITDNVLPHEKRLGDELLTRYFIASADAFIAMSKSVERDLRRFTTSKPVRVIPHPIYDNYGPLATREESLRALNLSPAYRYVLFFGFIRDYKGLDLLLQAFADERLKQLPLRLLVAGEFYTDEKPYRELIEKLELWERVVLHSEYIPSSKVRYYFGAADLVAQPYKSATQSGISQMAYHFEKPMVVTHVGGLPEIVPHGRAGYVVSPEPAAIAAAIADFFENDRLETLTAGVREEKTRFSWHHLVEGLEALGAEVRGRQ
ncbi:MAG: glycosyl transferase [Saprospiraceae bacterium]|nr:MAG: glycosyl transferase [Saprospiraceae bacterium]